MKFLHGNGEGVWLNGIAQKAYLLLCQMKFSRRKFWFCCGFVFLRSSSNVCANELPVFALGIWRGKPPKVQPNAISLLPPKALSSIDSTKHFQSSDESVRPKRSHFYRGISKKTWHQKASMTLPYAFPKSCP
jgi:hypothetical protein